MTEEQMRHAFQVLRPVCVKLTTDHSRNNVWALQACVNDIPSECLQKLQEYILFPLRLTLKQGKVKNEDFYCDILKCMSSVLENTEVQSADMFQDLFSSLCMFISLPGNPVRDVSEELKILTVQSLSSLVKSASIMVIRDIYKPSFLPVMGHAVSVLLHLVEKESNRELRILSADCLLDVALMQSGRLLNASVAQQMSRLFASFLPGITLTLSRVITGDTKQGYKVTVKAIEAWQKFVSLVMRDSYLSESSDEFSANIKHPAADKFKNLVVEKSDSWVKGTAEKLSVLVQKIKTVASHANWRVRLAMVEWAQEMLIHCSSSLVLCLSDFLEVLVGLVGDDYQNVARKSQAVLQEFKVKRGKESRGLVEMLEENLHALTLRLPRVMRTAIEEEKLSTLRLLSGYLDLLGPDLNHLLNSSTHLQKLGQSLVQVLELDCSSVRIIQERTAGGTLSALESGQLYSSPRKYFKHFTDPNIYKSLTNTCHMLGYYGNTELVFDHFLDVFHQSCVYRKQAILILNHICEGIAESCLNGKEQRTSKSLEPLIRSLLEVYLDSEYMDLITRCEPDETEGLMKSQQALSLQLYSATQQQQSSTLLEINSNILQTCLLLEGVAVCMQVLGKDHEYLMMDILYPVLEKVGHENHAISQTAYITLNTIKKTCQCRCVEDLLRHNTSYLVNSISVRLRHLESHPHTPSVLSVILAHSGPDILPQLEDTIREVLEALDSYYDEVGLLFVRVLYSLATAVLKWFPPENAVSKNTSLKSSGTEDIHFKSTPADVREFFIEYLKNKAVADSYAEEDWNAGDDSEKVDDKQDLDTNIEDTQAEGIMDEAEKESLPYHVEKTKQILEKCIHLLSAPEVKVKLVTLDTIVQGLHILQPYQNALLPLVHKLWPPFTQRLRDKDLVVVNKACKCLHTFAEVSEDFIKQRVIKDVFPHVILFLQKQAAVSIKAGSLYHQSLACKLQLSMLLDVGELCSLVQVGENHLADIIKACQPYLSGKQPHCLQQACVKTFRSFCRLEPDTVWLLVKELYNDDVMTPPHNSFPQPKITRHLSENEYTANVREVLKMV